MANLDEVGAVSASSSGWFGVANNNTNVEPEENKLKKVSVWDYANSLSANATMK